MRFTARLISCLTRRLKRWLLALLVEGSFSEGTPFFFRQALSFAFRLRFSRSRRWRTRSLPCMAPYCCPVLVVRKFAMPTSTPTVGADGSVSIGTSVSNESVSHHTPLRL